MRKRWVFVPAIVVVAAASVAMLAVISADDGWREVKPPGAGFVVRMPGEPKESVYDDKLGPFRQYSVLSDKINYTAAASRTNIPVTDLDRDYAEVIELHKTQHPGNVVSESEWWVGGRKGKEIVIHRAEADELIALRVLAMDGRLYIL